MSYTEKFISLYRKGKIDENTIIKMAAFKAELEDLSMTKEALKPLATAGIAALMGVASGVTALGVDSYMDAKEKARTQDAATKVLTSLSRDPEISKHPNAQIKKNFNALYEISPAIASNPVAAKSYLLNMLSWADSPSGVPITHFSELAKVQESIQKSRSSRGKSPGEVLLTPITQATSKAIPSDWLRN